MSVRSSSAPRPAALQANILAVERRIRRRRASISSAVAGISDNVRDRMISPGTLIAAGLFGAAIHHSHRLHGLRLLAIPQAVNTGWRLLLNAIPRARETPDQA